MKNTGWIKLSRALLNWEWYSDHNTTRLLIHLLVSVNFEDKKWQGITIKKGSMVVSWSTLSEKSGLSVRQCRTSMTKLVNCKEVTRKVTNKFQVVTLLKWDKIQVDGDGVDKQIDKQTTNKRQSNDNQTTTTKELNNIITKESKNTIKLRESEFKNSLQPFLKEFGKDILNKFYLYWTEKKPKGRKMRYEMEKTFDIKRRLQRWSNNNFDKKPIKQSVSEAQAEIDKLIHKNPNRK